MGGGARLSGAPVVRCCISRLKCRLPGAFATNDPLTRSREDVKGLLDRHVPAFDIAGFAEALVEPAYEMREKTRRLGVEEPDDRHRRLLRVDGERRNRPHPMYIA